MENYHLTRDPRRHQQNHAKEEAIVCGYPGCGKPFYRLDLLQRHEERQ
jgi:uncharacterized Zn-finger protein